MALYEVTMRKGKLLKVGKRFYGLGDKVELEKDVAATLGNKVKSVSFGKATEKPVPKGSKERLPTTSMNLKKKGMKK